MGLRCACSRCAGDDLRIGLAEGVPQGAYGREEVGEYYAAVIRRADRKADGFAGSPGAPEAPDPRWASDQVHEWVCLLRNRAEAARKGQIARKERLEEMEEHRKETDKRINEVQR